MSVGKTLQTLQSLTMPQEGSISRVDEGILTIQVGGFLVGPSTVALTRHEEQRKCSVAKHI